MEINETIQEFYLAEKRTIFEGVTDRHLRDSSSKLEKFFNFQRYGQRYLGDFKPRDIHLFFNYLEDDLNYSKGTVNRYASAISKVFKHAVKEELISHSPQFTWKKEEGGRPRYLSKEDIENLYIFLSNSGKPWVTDIFTVGLLTGMRLGEIRQVGSNANISKCKRFVENLNCKNKDSRKVPLSQTALEALERLGKVEDVFNQHQFYDLWREARDRFAGGDLDFVFHLTRHTCATKMANEMKINTIVIGKILGHKSQSTTTKYVHEDLDNLCDVVNKLEVAL